MSQSQRVVIVGAGSAGCVLAARLSENRDREVVLIEEGDWANTAGDSRSRGSLSSAFDPVTSRSWDLIDTGGRKIGLRSGRVVGGSSAVNGCYFIRPTGPDLIEWAGVAGPRYSTAGLARHFAKLESDRDFGDDPGHGSSGPVPVERDSDPLHPVSEAFRDAALAWGAIYEPDKNALDDAGDRTAPRVAGASGPPDGTGPGEVSGTWGTVGATGAGGIGPVPFNSRSGVRADMATCYLAPLIDVRPNLKVMTNARTTRVLLKGSAAVGVEVIDLGGRSVAIGADLVILAAGAIGSPGLLLTSGIGPADDVRRSGVDPVVDLPGVGANLFNHPTVELSYQPTSAMLGGSGTSDVGGPGDSDVGPSFMQLALHTSTATGGPGDFELMATRRPYGVVTGQRTGDTALSIRTTLLRPSGRGTVRPAPLAGGRDPATELVIAHRPTANASDRQALRAAVRLGDEILRSSAFRKLIDFRSGPSAQQLASDAELDGWIRANAGFSFHQMGTCAMGTVDDIAVVDPEFLVRGVDRLAVVDASVIPVGLSRGPAAAVVALAEAAAEVLGTVG
ncbi:MAG: GMC family oxidoreductase N-terminal domain-containing protein [Microthrixaceae bacterium]